MKQIAGKWLTAALGVWCLSLVVSPTFAQVPDSARSSPEPAAVYPDRFMFRVGNYYLEDSSTAVSLNSSLGLLGTTIDFQRDLGGDQRTQVPRLAGYYRFTDKHRLDFGWFELERKGQRSLAIEIQFGDELIEIGNTVASVVDSTLFKLAYTYSFYRAPQVELGFTAGLHTMRYDVELHDLNDDTKETAAVTAPLPVFGLRMDYSITPRWVTRFTIESFYIEIDDTIRGSLLDLNLDLEYRLARNLALGLGAGRLAIDAQVSDDSYNGELNDLYRGFQVFAVAYF